MGKSWPKILRDPIHNLITFHDNEWDRLLLKLLGCKEVQRLRRIKQLGFSELVFPGANHGSGDGRRPGARVNGGSQRPGAADRGVTIRIRVGGGLRRLAHLSLLPHAAGRLSR